MRPGRRILLVTAVGTLVALLAIGLVPPARGWVATRVLGLRARAVLSRDFGARLGSVQSGEWHLEDRLATGLTVGLYGGLSEQDLCRVMLALDGVAPSEPALLSALVVRPDAQMTFESLVWNRATGRLERWAGSGPYSASLSTSEPSGAIPSGVDRGMLRRFAGGVPIAWR